jgi:hypothetical protein
MCICNRDPTWVGSDSSRAGVVLSFKLLILDSSRAGVVLSFIIK